MAAIDISTPDEIDLGLSFSTPAINGPCGLSLGPIPFAILFVLKLPKFSLFFPIPEFNLSFNLSCDIHHPVDITGGLKWGGGRTPKFHVDPVQKDDF